MTIQHAMVKQAISHLVIKEPYFASMLLNMEIEETEKVKTFATDGKNLFFSPTFASCLNFDQIVGTIIHEICHVSNYHVFRKGNRDHEDWNRACDYAVNSAIIKSGYKLPENIKDKDGKVIFDKACIDDVFDGKSAEDIYRIIHDPNKQKGGGGSSGTGKDEYEGTTFGEVIQHPDPEAGEQEVRINNKIAENNAKRHGKGLTDALAREIKREKPNNNWREILKNFVSEQYPRDYSWSKPNRRYLYTDIVLPSLDGKVIGNIAIAVDTSGSVSSEELNKMVGEVFNCMETLLEDKGAFQLPVISCDDQVRGVQVLESVHDTPSVKGGGETDFAPIFQHIKDNKEGYYENLKCIIVVTDGYCDSHGVDPEIPVLWAITTDAGLTYSPRPFGEVMKFDIHH